MKKSVLKKLNNMRGVTLTELVVVLVILGVISSLVVSFSTLISAKTEALSKENDLMEVTTSLNDMFDKWIGYYDKTDCVFSVKKVSDTEKEGICACLNEIEYYFYVNEDGRICAEYPGDDGNKTMTKSMEAVNYGSYRVEHQTDRSYLISVTVTVRIDGKSKDVKVVRCTRGAV